MSAIDRARELRLAIKDIAERTKIAKGTATDGEAIANFMLAYRHLEDASMRLGKVIQALDGGISVYDKSTVGT
jgi:hypothetical protein